jgi:Asp-tRNA(Asn)/Glu-tRNA(Gln) amidotransferase A subunit family amidase
MHDLSDLTTTPETTPEAARDQSAADSGLSRRSFVGRSGAVAAAGAVLATGALPGAASAATQAGTGRVATPRAAQAADAPPLPDVAAIKAQNKPLVDHEVIELAALLQAGEITSVAITQAYIARIDAFNGPFGVYADNGGYNTFVRIDAAAALAEAAAADARLQAARAGGDAAPYLCGIPIGVKDSVGVEGRVSSNGSPAYANNVANADSTAVARLRDQGVVFIGHTICSAFSSEIAGNFAGNAWNKEYIPGGSSQGSGAAPINRLAAAAIGEETGGSIIWPAALNGASAIKPSLGLGSVAGVMPLSPTYDVLGPLARSGRDAALLMNALVGPDPAGDPQTLSAPVPFPALPITPRQGSKPLKGITIGIPQTDWMLGTGAGTDVPPQSTYAADHKAAFDRVRGELEGLGATVKEFRGLDIQNTGTAGGDFLDGENAYFGNPKVLQTIDGTAVTPANAVTYANRAEIRYVEAVRDYAATQSDDAKARLLTAYGRRPGGATTGTRTFEAQIALTSGVTAEARHEGERRRRIFIEAYQEALDDAGVDFMLVMSIGAEVGKRDPTNASAGLPLRRNNQIANALSWPMVNFPVGKTDNVGLPICVQFWGPRFSEPRLVQAMIDYQAAHPEHHTRFPADPAPAPSVATRAMRARSAETPAPADPFLSNDPAVYEDAVIAERG